jgi:hypothetical protein
MALSIAALMLSVCLLKCSYAESGCMLSLTALSVLTLSFNVRNVVTVSVVILSVVAPHFLRGICTLTLIWTKQKNLFFWIEFSKTFFG